VIVEYWGSEQRWRWAWYDGIKGKCVSNKECDYAKSVAGLWCTGFIYGVGMGRETACWHEKWWEGWIWG